jgi:hypothetical protein
MGSGLCPVAGCCDRGNEPSRYTKGWIFLTGYTSVVSLQLALLCACVTTYRVTSPDRHDFWKWRMWPTSRYYTGFGLKKTEVNRDGQPAIAARCISNANTSINLYRCITLLDISVIVRDITVWQCYISICLIKLPLALADCKLTCREPDAVRDPHTACSISTIFSQFWRTDNFYG